MYGWKEGSVHDLQVPKYYSHMKTTTEMDGLTTTI